MPERAWTILLVEDDSQLRTSIFQCLTKSGYTVIEASNGQEAMSIVEQKGRKHINLVITDVEMPGASGVQLAMKLKRTAPDLKVLFMSGSTLPADAQSIAKPFTAHELLSKVRGLVDSI